MEEGQGETFDESDQVDSEIRKNMHSLWRDEELCDFTIIIDDDQRRFPVHKVVLASCLDYFKCMFYHDSLEVKRNEAVIGDISSTAMEQILQFCYTSRLTLNNDNVQEILTASNRIQHKKIENICINYIRKRIDDTNCMGILMTADQCNLRDLYETSLEYCLDRFGRILKEREFTSLDEDSLVKLVSNDRLNVDDEEQVLDAIFKWIEYDKINRESKFENLAGHIRFALMDLPKLVLLPRSVDSIYNSQICRDLVDDAKNFVLLRDNPEFRHSPTDRRFEVRTPIRKQQRIYAIGGWTSNASDQWSSATASVEKFDPYKDEWIEVNPMSKPRCGVGVAILNNSLYAIGGHDGQNYLKSVELLNIDDETWSREVADMGEERTSVCVVALNGFIYAIGGQCGTTKLNLVERYDPETNSWETRRSMLEKRQGAGVTVLNGYIYVVGGADEKVSATVERYDDNTNEWNYVANMTTGRKHLSCTTYGGKVYAVGGHSDQCELDSAECYDPILNEWKPIACMRRCRSGISLVELDGQLYAAGGQNGDCKLNLVESYDPKTNTWTSKKPMLHNRLGAGLVVSSKLKSLFNK